MKTKRSRWSKRAAVLLLVLVASLISVTGVSAVTRSGGGGSMPLYARLEPGPLYTDGTYVSIVFYHDIECIDPGFNMLEGMTFAALECPNTTDGFMLWEGEPWLETSVPVQIKIFGLGAVPIWFVSLTEMQAAMGDGMLTIGELEAFESLLKGTATFYTEILHPVGVVAMPMIEYTGHGSLEDGRSFFVQAVGPGDENKNVTIQFK